MQTSELKVRAKRLRTAIQTVLGVSVSNSQALEIVAKEENYPNWDAACSCTTHHTEKPSRRFLMLSEITLIKPHVLISGNTNTGKTTLAREVSNHLASFNKLRQSLNVAVISHNKEWNADNFISPFDPDFEERIERLDLSRTVLLIEEQVGVGGKDDFWFQLAKKACAAVVTVHTGNLKKIDAQALDCFQSVDCNKASDSAQKAHS